MQYRFLLILATAFHFNVLMPIAHAGDENAIRMGSMEQPPYGFVDDDGVKKGYLFDVANLTLIEAGFAPHELVSPPKRLIRDMTLGTLDCSFFAKTPLIIERFSFIEPIGKNLEAGVLPKFGVKIEEYDDLYGLNIAVPRGVFIDDRFDVDEQLIKTATNDYYQSALMLSRGRVDAILGATDSLLYNFNKLGVDTSTMLDKPFIFKSIPVGLVCRKEIAEEKRVLRLKEAVIKLRESGKISTVIAKYFKPNLF